MHSPEPAAAGQPTHSDARLPYLPGLDGLRALAVIAVVLYHAGLNVRGGFLGVESFFVLSGDLITGLLVAEWLRDGGIDVRAFWIRRARRLLPALFVLLAGMAVAVAVLLPDERGQYGGDALAALGYVLNWRLVLSGQSYFDPTLRPPLLQHLWSLAVEEQFYLLWPLLFAAGARFLRPAGLLAATLALACGSIVLLAALHEPGADPSRVYYGTDTRAAALLLGSALAMVWMPGHLPWTGKRSGRALDLAGLLALGMLLLLYRVLNDGHPLLYPYGLGMVTLATGIVIAATAHPEARLVSRLLGFETLRWIGQRSYSIYLWHWPVMMLTRPYVDLPFGGWPLLALRIAAVLLLADASYRLVEIPIRSGAWRPAVRQVMARLRAYADAARARGRRLTGSDYRSLEPRLGPPVRSGSPDT